MAAVPGNRNFIGTISSSRSFPIVANFLLVNSPPPSSRETDQSLSKSVHRSATAAATGTQRTTFVDTRFPIPSTTTTTTITRRHRGTCNNRSETFHLHRRVGGTSGKGTGTGAPRVSKVCCEKEFPRLDPRDYSHPNSAWLSNHRYPDRTTNYPLGFIRPSQGFLPCGWSGTKEARKVEITRRLH